MNSSLAENAEKIRRYQPDTHVTLPKFCKPLVGSCINQSTAFHQFGRFIFLFQHIESALTELLVLMAEADDEAVRILANELEFSKRVKTTDVMFA
ncbi:MAG TPA: hypothetical protein VFX02_05435 [Gammaproteobacteria bacterium]|nr:hypothetical protein [Gammaproteobacteria bacterium]